MRVGLIFFIGFVLFLSSGCSSVETSGEVKEERNKPVEVFMLEDSVMVTSQSYRGKLEPIQMVNLTFEAGGTLVNVNKRKGDTVSSGELIASLDNRDANIAYERATAQMQQAKVNYDQVRNGAVEDVLQRELTVNQSKIQYEQLSQEVDRQKAELERSKELFTNGLIAQVELDRVASELERLERQVILAEQDIQRAESQQRLLGQGTNSPTVEQARAAYEQALTIEKDAALQKEKRNLYALLSGIILESNLTVGEQISMNQAAVTIGDITSLRITFDVPVSNKDDWAVGGIVEIDYKGDIKEGTVIFVSPIVKESTSMIEVEIEVTNEDGEWLAGEYASVMGQKTEVQGFYVPTVAILENTERFIYIVEDEIARKIPVQVGMPMGSLVEVVALKEGILQKGMQVIVGGLQRIQDGDQVSVMKGDQS